MRFRRFQTRVAVFVVGLLTLVSASTFLAVSVAVTRNARAQIRDELTVGGNVFARLIGARTRQLADSARLLSGDFAFKAAASSDDRATMLSVLENHQARIGADVMQLMSLEGTLLADTRQPDAAGSAFPFPHLLVPAERGAEASAIASIDRRTYQMVVVPLLAPLPVAWISVGFLIDDEVAKDLQRLLGLQVSFLRRSPGGGFTAVASTLPGPMRDSLLRELPQQIRESTTMTSVVVGEGKHEYVTLVTTLDRASESGIVAALQRSLDEALQPFRRLQLTLLVLTAAGLGISLAGAIVIARRVTRPVLTIAEGARRVLEGDYEHAVAVNLSDEIGELARTFNTMTKGLAERDRIRAELERVARLKRFLSPQVAELIVSAGDEHVLASHRRDITAVFVDLRGFTAFSEQAEPEDVMGLLQDYHDRFGPLVSRFEATIGSFAGDGVMVFFNDPLPFTDHAARAVRLAIAMREQMVGLVEIWRQRGYTLGAGTGIAMGFATMGRIGFEGRFDYAAIGSVTNLAARLCAEARDGQILVSQPVFGAVKELVEAEEIPPLHLKGFAQPVAAYNILTLKEPSA